jgi:Ribbon-helix-helix protein, copG family
MSTQEKRSIDLRVRLTPKEAQQLRKLAARDAETTVSVIVRRAIRRYIEQIEGKVIEPGEGKLLVPKGRVPGIKTPGSW